MRLKNRKESGPVTAQELSGCGGAEFSIRTTRVGQSDIEGNFVIKGRVTGYTNTGELVMDWWLSESSVQAVNIDDVRFPVLEVRR